MRKYGKYEKQPEAVPAKQPTVKSALLQTYFISLVCLVMCVCMFFGTSYAWFTSEVENTQNEIFIGTLDVGLYKQGKGEGAAPLDLANNANKLFDDNIRWEPGYTYLETLEVVNKGDLAFRYVLTFVEETGTEGSLAEIAQYFDVWVYKHYNKTYEKPSSYTEITAVDSGWDNIGTLADLFAGKAVVNGRMYTVRDNKDTTPANEGTTDGVATVDTYTIALHMNDKASADAMGKRISLKVKLVAYQMTSEEDSLNGTYDYMVMTPTELEDALKNGGNIVLAADVDVKDETLVVPEGVTAVLNLNGHKITTTTDKMGSLITNSGDLTINGEGDIALVFNGEATTGAAVNTISNRGVLTVNGGTISNTGLGNQIGYAIDNYNGATLTVNGGEITASGSSYYDGIRLFCGSNETLVTVNGGKISTIWAQNPSANKASEVKGTVIVNGGEIGKVYYENYTVVKVKSGISVSIEAYGEGKENANATNEGDYTVYRFKHD